ncbi:MAG TPA: site-specific integrase, partial [Leptolyngbyaceae cyanobacterium M65_K2018_010]|nr:site-specific integrase [Leptolyngbyaceae cyanobacterium M65_K2018_010]
FRERVWKRTCERAGIEYRPPYTSRHTLLSHGIEYEGWSLPQAAQIAGHASTRMVAETYGHMINPPKLPEF